MGPGCAFLDYDSDGWLDILLVNGMDWPGHKRQATTLRLYRNNRNGTFTDVTAARRARHRDVRDGRRGRRLRQRRIPGCPGHRRRAESDCSRTPGKADFVDVTAKAGLGGESGFSTSAMWFDYDRDGHLDLFVCNYVQWSPRARRVLQRRWQE